MIFRILHAGRYRLAGQWREIGHACGRYAWEKYRTCGNRNDESQCPLLHRVSPRRYRKGNELYLSFGLGTTFRYAGFLESSRSVHRSP